MGTSRKGHRRKGRLSAAASVQDRQVSLRQPFGTVAPNTQAARRRKDLAILKILQLIVSGRIPRPAGEDYLVSVCRLVRHGGSGLGVSAATRRALGVALAGVKLADQGTTNCTNLQAMRAWRGKRTIIRAVLLLNALERSVGPVALVAWLQRPNPNLGRRPPVDLMRADHWLTLADFLDDMLTGSPN